MQQRPFGRTGISVSERGFGAWAIGGTSYGPVTPGNAMNALARAEDLGCNFVDTAAVYGESEALLGRFMRGRREKWVIGNKYSAQPPGMMTFIDEQLARLRTDHIDYYQVHWAPSVEESDLYEQLGRLKQLGKIRFAGISLRNPRDLDRVLANDIVDGVQIPVSLLDPSPLSPGLQLIRKHGPAVIARSALKSGFLTGKYHAATRFSDAADERSKWDISQIETVSRHVGEFRFLERDAVTLRAAALAYPLSFAEVSTLVISCKDSSQVEANLGAALPMLTAEDLERIRVTQKRLRLGSPPSLRARVLRKARSLFAGK